MKAIAAGHICLDILPDLSAHADGRFQAAFQPGRLLRVGPAALTPGGSVSNTGLALHKFGVDTRLVAKVGADDLGNTLRGLVARIAPGMETGLVPDAAASTSYSIVISPPGVDRTFLHHPGANDLFSAADVSDADLAGADLFHFGYPPIMAAMYADGGTQLETLFRRVKARGLTTSLDMAFPDPSSPGGRADWRAILRRVLPFVDVFSPSLDEMLFMLGYAKDSTFSADLLERVGSELLGMGARVVALKLGDRGLYLRAAPAGGLQRLGRARPANLAAWDGFHTWAPCFRVDVAGTTGAGDVTTAGLLAAILRGLPPEKAIDFALAAGACCVEAPDALSGLRSWGETWKRIETGWSKRAL